MPASEPCANCDHPAVFEINDPWANPVRYCRADLPVHLHERAARGDFDFPKRARSARAKASTGQ